jgi:hypothetical protein
MRLLTLTAIVLVVSGSALAQGGAGTGIPIGVRPQPSIHQSHFRQPIFIGGAWYPGYGTDVVQSVPQVIVLQQPAPVAPVVKEDPKPITPLMIELQDGKYVRSDRTKKPVQQAAVTTVRKMPVTDTQPTANAVVPAVLIFRDGHHEQVREYTVVDGAIYTHGDYWTDGYWNKKILLSAIDVPATLAANQASGSHFALPSAPNVVVVGP